MSKRSLGTAAAVVVVIVIVAAAAFLFLRDRFRTSHAELLARMENLESELRDTNEQVRRIQGQLSGVMRRVDELANQFAELRNRLSAMRDAEEVQEAARPATPEEVPPGDEDPLRLATFPPPPFSLFEQLTEEEKSEIKVRPASLIHRNSDGSTTVIGITYSDGSTMIRSKDLEPAMEFSRIVTRVDRMTRERIDTKIASGDFERFDDREKADARARELDKSGWERRVQVKELDGGFLVIDVSDLEDRPEYQDLIERRDRILEEIRPFSLAWSILR